MKNNKKGFTLIELLAVIVILAILVMIAIPMVTRYLNTARKSTYSDNALRAVEAVRSDIISRGFNNGQSLDGTNTGRKCAGGKCYYNQEAINALLENKFDSSSFGNAYKCLGITVDQANNTYTMYMVDDGPNGFAGLTSDQISAEHVGTGKVWVKGTDGLEEATSYTTCPANTDADNYKLGS